MLFRSYSARRRRIRAFTALVDSVRATIGMPQHSPSLDMDQARVGRTLRALLHRRANLLQAVLLLGLGVWAAAHWVETVAAVIRYYTPLPVWDYWRTVIFLPNYRALDVSVLWHQHNEHRIVFPEILFALDYLLLRGRQLLPLALNFLCYISTWLVLAWALSSDRTIPAWTRAAAILLAGVIMGWQGSAFEIGRAHV